MSEKYNYWKDKKANKINKLNKTQKEYRNYGQDKNIKNKKIIKNKEDMISYNEEDIKTGTYKRNEKGFGFVNIGDNLEEIHISKELSFGALNGDEVLVKLFSKTEEKDKRQEGKIIKIIKHNKETLVGLFKQSKTFGFVIPDNKAFSNDIYIQKKYFNGAKNKQKVVVQITKFEENGNKAEGKIIEILGYQDEAGIDILSLVKEYRLPYEFPEKVIEEANHISQTINIDKKDKRVDLRNEEMFTIDGEDAKDLDDAVSVKKNKDGTYTLGVYIADVSHYVTDGSELNKEAIIRGTSIYMMDRVIPMLPKELSNGICSLNEGQDRFSLACIMQIDTNGKVIDSVVEKAIVKITKRMNYHDVNNIFQYVDMKENKISNEELDMKKIEISYKKYEKYINHFLLMRELKNILKNRRIKNGYLNLDIPESKITLDNRGIAIDIGKYDYLESNEVVEQFMLTANESVAEKFYWIKAPFIYRVHEKPNMEKVEDLNKFLFNLGYKIKGIKADDDESIRPKAFAEILEQIKGREEERVISTLILRTLKMAKYESENKGHFGIASKCYCHFTSPIRRYPDLYIHRIISSYIDAEYNINDKLKNKFETETTKYAESSSEREKIAQKVERDAEDIKKAEYMETKVGEIYDGIISGVTQFGVFVELENTIEGLIRFDDLGNEYYIFDEEKRELIGEKSKKIYKIGDKIKIQVISANKQDRRIDFSNADYKIRNVEKEKQIKNNSKPRTKGNKKNKNKEKININYKANYKR